MINFFLEDECATCGGEGKVYNPDGCGYVLCPDCVEDDVYDKMQTYDEPRPEDEEWRKKVRGVYSDPNCTEEDFYNLGWGSENPVISSLDYIDDLKQKLSNCREELEECKNICTNIAVQRDQLMYMNENKKEPIEEGEIMISDQKMAIEVDCPELSEAIQKKAFNYGYEWPRNQKKVSHTEHEVLLIQKIDEKQRIKWAEDFNFYTLDKNYDTYRLPEEWGEVVYWLEEKS